MRVVDAESIEGYHYQVQALSLQLRHESDSQVRATLALRLADVARELATMELAQAQSSAAPDYSSTQTETEPPLQ